LDDVDSIFELQTIINSSEITGKILLRINLSENVSYSLTKENQELMAHAESSSKFGIPEEEVEKIVSSLSIPISGLHVHVGTQMDNILSFENAINRLNRLSEHLNKKFDLKITEINLGGGLGIPFSNSDKFPSIDYWCNYMNKLKDLTT
jgi:diaminopimelate decarboxylase